MYDANGGSASQPNGTGGLIGYASGGGNGYNAGAGNPNQQAGGGGGAGGAGVNAASNYAGDGGPGRTYTISGSSVVYAAGGGGGSRNNSMGAGGSSGVGGRGGSGAQTAGDGVANTGSGGGGIRADQAGSGADGIVIIRYKSATNLATGGTITTDGDYKVHTFTSDGTFTTLTTAISKPDTSSIKFDGTGDYLSVPDGSDWDFGTDAFTMEAWIRVSDFNGGSGSETATIVSSGSSSYGDWFLAIWSVGGVNKLGFYGPGGWKTGSTTISADTWYHAAVTRSGNTWNLWLNGTAESGDFPLTESGSMSTSTALSIGRRYSSSAWKYLDGYLDEIRISNTARYTSAFTPSTTAFTADSNTLLLIHSDFNGGLGADNSGNKNDYDITNITVSDQVLDSPTNNFATLNPVAVSKYAITSMGEGNLYYAGGSTYSSSVGTIEPTSGKWYTEVYVNAIVESVGSNGWLGVTRTDYPGQAWWDTPFNRTGSVGLQGNGQAWKDGSPTSSDSSGDFDAGDIVGILMNLDDGEIKFKVNNSDFSYTTSITVDGVWTPCVQTYATGNNFTFNFGQDSSFAGNKTAQGNQDGNGKGDFYYTPPSGFLALCTDNLDDPSIADPTDHFNTVLYSGNSTARSITGVGFAPDFTALKSRSYAYNHSDYDTLRGATKQLIFDAADPEVTYLQGLTAFDSDGFSLGTGSQDNNSGQTYVAWNWKAGGTAVSNTDGTITSSVSANTTAGFSIVSFDGNGTSGATVGHGLSQAPELIIVKGRNLSGSSASAGWVVYSKPVGNTKYLYLNESNAEATDSGRWNDTTPTASVFTLGDDGVVNTGSSPYIAYCFHSVDGYSKVGSYTGNGNNDGTFVHTGFRPMWVMAKCSNASASWLMTDSVRFPYNVTDDPLFANESSAETNSSTYAIDILSNGFKCRGVNNNTNNSSNDTYIYLAFAESPFKYSNAR